MGKKRDVLELAEEFANVGLEPCGTLDGKELGVCGECGRVMGFYANDHMPTCWRARFRALLGWRGYDGWLKETDR